jgi:PilZ domain/Abortive infection alpha
MTGPKDWLENFLKLHSGGVERRSSERQSIDQFASYRWNGSSVKQDAVRDISSTGLYILTEERWQIGALLLLTLQREGPLEMNPEGRIEVQAKVVRHGEDGVGLTFVLPADPDSRQWESLRDNLIEKAKPEDMRCLVRMNEAVGFLSRISPGGAEKVGQLLASRLTNHKLENAVAIALKGENLLAFDPVTDQLRADPDLVVRILEDGSCTDEDWLRHFWGGLLATSCAANGKEESNLAFVELLSQLTTFPVRILTVVCTRATKVLAESGLISAKPLTCKIEELMLTTGSQGLQFERDFERLSELGLIEKRDSNSPTLLSCEETEITPSSLGLQLFARCNGHRGSLPEFYAAASR